MRRRVVCFCFWLVRKRPRGKCTWQKTHVVKSLLVFACPFDWSSSWREFFLNQWHWQSAVKHNQTVPKLFSTHSCEKRSSFPCVFQFNLTVVTVDLFGFWLLIQFHTAEDQSGNFFTRETELFTRVVAEFVRKYWAFFVNFVFVVLLKKIADVHFACHTIFFIFEGMFAWLRRNFACKT